MVFSKFTSTEDTNFAEIGTQLVNELKTKFLLNFLL